MLQVLSYAALVLSWACFFTFTIHHPARSLYGKSSHLDQPCNTTNHIKSTGSAIFDVTDEHFSSSVPSLAEPESIAHLPLDTTPTGRHSPTAVLSISPINDIGHIYPLELIFGLCSGMDTVRLDTTCFSEVNVAQRVEIESLQEPLSNLILATISTVFPPFCEDASCVVPTPCGCLLSTVDSLPRSGLISTMVVQGGLSVTPHQGLPSYCPKEHGTTVPFEPRNTISLSWRCFHQMPDITYARLSWGVLSLLLDFLPVVYLCLAARSLLRPNTVWMDIYLGSFWARALSIDYPRLAV